MYCNNRAGTAKKRGRTRDKEIDRGVSSIILKTLLGRLAMWLCFTTEGMILTDL